MMMTTTTTTTMDRSGKGQTYLSVQSDPTESSDILLRAPARSTGDFPASFAPQYGKPAGKSYVDVLDTLAVALTLTCLGLAVVTVDPRVSLALRLGFGNQIIVLGFLLGIMNQCLQRVVSYLFLLLEARFGTSTLQNYEGLLRWSPFVSRLGTTWRAALVGLSLLPLGLSVSYKTFTGGLASADSTTQIALYGPTAPPGMQENIGRNAVMSNFTSPFMAATTDDRLFSTESVSLPQTFGFNLVLLANTSAAALDAPDAARVSAIQQSLRLGSSANLSAIVRGTVARYNASVGDAEYRTANYIDAYAVAFNLFNNYSVNMMQKGVAFDAKAKSWNGSWVLINTFSTANWTSNNTETTEIFYKGAMRFDVKRHNCSATWKITRGSIELATGDCAAEPLPDRHQYYDNAQLTLVDNFGRSLADHFGPFATSRNRSQWRLPTYAAVIASAYQSGPAAQRGHFPIQPSGRIWSLNPDRIENCWNYTGAVGNCFIERYNSTEVVHIETPVLRNTWGLIFVLAIQPVLTTISFFAACALFHVPVSRTFGLVSVMAGVNRESLNLLSGASFSGELRQPVGLRISVRPLDAGGHRDVNLNKIEYDIGQRGTGGYVQRRKTYF